MLFLVFKKVTTFFLMLWIVVSMVFFLMRFLPASPNLWRLGEHALTLKEVPQNQTNTLFSDYIHYLSHLSRFQFGNSLITGESVKAAFLKRAPVTLELSFLAIILGAFGGIFLGVLAALSYQRWPDRIISFLSLSSFSMPIFFWGILLLLGFEKLWGEPSFEMKNQLIFSQTKTGFLLLDTLLKGRFDEFLEAFKMLLPPALTLSLIPFSVLTKQTRVAVVEALQKEHVRAAMARGIPRARLIFRHVLYNAFSPLITSLSLVIASFLSGTVIVETVFAHPGLGLWLTEGILERDYPVVQGGLLFSACSVLLVNASVDFLQTLFRSGANNLAKEKMI